MNRRSYLVACGALCGGLAGCMGDSNDGTGNTISQSPTTQATETATGTPSFQTTSVEGVEVRLVPVDVTHRWYQNDAARFADARGKSQYRRSHITDAVLSTAPDGVNDDPVSEWPKDERIVCYCGCPHHLSSLRAATLIQNGYEEVYVIDEGFWEWKNRGYPVSGEAVSDEPATDRITGQTAAEYAGETAWAWHEPTEQREATPIAADGSYELELHFFDVDPESTIAVETPGYHVEGTLSELTSQPVTGP